MNMFPYIYEPEKSIEVYTKTQSFLQENHDIYQKIQNLGWVYHEVGGIIPQTTVNFWSGHSFPFDESWDDLQISFTQCSFGLYKQAFGAMRSALELGLLSVYYNINDEGHETVSDWYASKDDANTPRTEKIWKIILSNKNIQKFNEKFNIRQKFDDLSYLHNYVHTKGVAYSNSFGGLKGNSQVFVHEVFEQWLLSYESIVSLIATLHLLKYPLAVIEFDYFKKFGVDMPNFGGLVKSKLDRIASILPVNYLEEIKAIAEADEQTQITLNEIKALPDKTEEEMEEQVIGIYKFSVQHGEGFIEWEKQQYQYLEQLLSIIPESAHAELRKITQQRIGVLKVWAVENNFLEPKAKRMGWDQKS